MTFNLPSLPYAEDALEPYYSAKTISFHHGKHHKAYVDNLNKLIAGTELESKGLEEIILAAAGDPARVGLFNNAAQVWNHTFFWHCMKSGGGGKPAGELARRIDQAFGSYEKFAEQFKATAVGRFGSGWGWLVLERDALKLVSTPNAETPMTKGQTALLTVDVWEHAYYLDYQNRRPDFVQAFLDHLVDWDFVTENLARAK
ncbi:MAG: superoxide dismutase [Fe] [Chloroflexi bacterium HGW-Chloroflexi-1]|nr:MAG: superoxide dismutase [Fe] [Chloroflexi bacterium HGW-Chloroflexi-1]